jgi:hypothetical protein
MELTHRGKIGRLPESIREEVNVRLRRGEKGREVCDWLNSLAEVQALLAEEFDARPVREQNVSEWRRGGHQQWLRLQEAYMMMERIGPDAEVIAGAAKEPMTETLATWLAARYMVAAKSAEGLGGDKASGWDRMREFCHDVIALRRGEHLAQRLEFDRVRAGLAIGGMTDCK